MTSLQNRADDATRPEGLPDYDEGEAATILDTFAVTELGHAAWCARKLRTITDRIARAKRVRDEQVAQLDAWLAKETAKLADDAAFFDGRLEMFHRLSIDRDAKAKTIDLPDGTALRSQAGKVSVDVTDADALMRWAETEQIAADLFEFPDPKPKRPELGQRFGGKAKGTTDAGEFPAVTDDGEIVPGVTLRRGERTFTRTLPAAFMAEALEAATEGADDE